MSSVLEIAKKINKAWKEDVLTDGTIIPECERIPLGTLGSDFPLFGGVPMKQITVFAGQEHSGKTLAACQCMSQYQKKYPNNTCIYVDAEQSLTAQLPFIVKMTGLEVDDSSKFLRYDCSGKSGEEIFQDIIQLQQAENIGLIIIDSAPALVSQADLDNDFIRDMGQRASIAKPLGKFLKQMIMYLPKRDNALIVINQVRESGTTFTGAKIYTEPCGHSLKYYPSMKVRFGTRTYTNGDKSDLGSNKAEEADGFRLKFSITKSRLGPASRGGGFLTYRYSTGLDEIGDLLEVALKYEFIRRPTTQSYELINLDSGEIYSNENGEPLKFVGKAKLIEYINSNEKFRKEYIDMLNRNINKVATGKSLLDDETMKEILYQEQSVENNVPKEELEEKEELENGK